MRVSIIIIRYIRVVVFPTGEAFQAARHRFPQLYVQHVLAGGHRQPHTAAPAETAESFF